ncbi:STAS domain-containing protein [Mycobacterium pinniadriaticum]|nr:STAS domain-containing protein [Mycobacterium pinniadriaticum]
MATVVAVSGRIDSANVDDVTGYAKRLILADMPFVLDLSGVSSFTPQSIRLLCDIDDICASVGVEWAVVASDAVNRRLRRDSDVVFPVVGSVAEAEHEFDDAILNRRRMLLPLLSKSA